MHPAFPRNQASLSFPPPSPKPSGSSTSIVPSLRAGPLLRTGLMGMAMLSSGLASAAPDAGQALRDVESRRLNLPAPVELDAERPSPEDGVSRAAEEGGPTVLVKRFQLSGNRQFDDRRLLALLHDLPGQELNLSQLHAAAARIGDFYREKGYVLARAFLPAQEIQDGTVRIEVLEGRYGRIELHNTSRTLDRVLLRPLSALERDTAVQGSELERALLLLSDIPGLQAKGTLLPGQAQGTTDLRVEARPGPLVGGRLEADNYGGRYMGEYRLGTTLDFNSPLRLGDQARLSLLGSDRHQRYYRAAYQLPLGSRGTRIGLAHAETTYRLVRDFSRLDAHGRAITDSLFVSQPLLRSRSLSLSTQLQYENKRLRDDQERTGRHSRKEIRLWTASISGNAQDRLFGGGQSGFSLAYAHGQLAIDSAEERLLDRYTIGTAGSFDKIMLNAVRLQHLGDRLQLFAQLQPDRRLAPEPGKQHRARAHSPAVAASDPLLLSKLPPAMPVGPTERKSHEQELYAGLEPGHRLLERRKRRYPSAQQERTRQGARSRRSVTARPVLPGPRLRPAQRRHGRFRRCRIPDIHRWPAYGHRPAEPQADH